MHNRTPELVKTTAIMSIMIEAILAVKEKDRPAITQKIPINELNITIDNILLTKGNVLSRFKYDLENKQNAIWVIKIDT